jgi:hypothetical protein
MCCENLHARMAHFETNFDLFQSIVSSQIILLGSEGSCDNKQKGKELNTLGEQDHISSSEKAFSTVIESNTMDIASDLEELQDRHEVANNIFKDNVLYEGDLNSDKDHSQQQLVPGKVLALVETLVEAENLESRHLPPLQKQVQLG